MVKRRHKIIISKGDINNEPFQNKSSENQVEIFLLNVKGCVYLRVTSKRRTIDTTTNRRALLDRQFRCNLTQTDLTLPTLKPTQMG